MLNFNPFKDVGITRYDQFKNLPFLVSPPLQSLKRDIDEAIKDKKNGYIFGDRMLILGNKGIGKTSALFCVKKTIEEAGMNCMLFARPPVDQSHLVELSGKSVEDTICGDGFLQEPPVRLENQKFSKSTWRPLFLLIDFPDDVRASEIKGSLRYLDALNRSPIADFLSIYISLNKSHYHKSFDHSQLLGKFESIRLDPFDAELTQELIEKRLTHAGAMCKDVFEDKTFDVIQQFSQGIPRNIITIACSLIRDSRLPISAASASLKLKDNYAINVLNDRVSNPLLLDLYKEMIHLLKTKFSGRAERQMDYLAAVTETTGITDKTLVKRLKELQKMGLITIQKGGPKRYTNIISLN